jgi:hypothetical protein
MKEKLTPRVEGIDVAPRLPFPPQRCVTLRANTSGELFLDRLQEAISQAPDWSFRLWHSHYSGRGKSLVLSYTGNATAEGVEDLLVELHVAPDSSSVELLFKAREWPEEVLSYEAYVEAAGLFKSAIRLYNKVHNTRLRLLIPRPDDLEPKLTLNVCVYFDWFGQEARERPYNPTTWRRLYSFLTNMDRRKIPLATEDFCRLLRLYGVDAAAIEMYSGFYMRVREMSDFVRRRPWDLCPTEDVWNKWCGIVNERKASNKAGRRITLG